MLVYWYEHDMNAPVINSNLAHVMLARQLLLGNVSQTAQRMTWSAARNHGSAMPPKGLTAKQTAKFETML